MEAIKTNVSVVMVPFPAQGHLNQLLHLALTLSAHGLTVHYAAFEPHIQQAKSRLQGRPKSALDNLHFHKLPMPSFSCPPPDPNSTVSFPTHLQPLFEASELAKPHIASLLHSLSATSRRIVVIFDRFVSFAAREAAAFPNAESYCFQCVPISQDLVFLGNVGPAGDLLQSHGLSIPSLDGCITEDFLALVIRHYKMSGIKYSGILLNTCRLIEGEFIEFLAQQPDFIGKRNFAIGPLNPTTSETTNGQRHWSLEWLDNQPSQSVLYISFGSITSLSDKQIEQLAIGLLNSGQRFIWVLREADRADGSSEKTNDQHNKLPSGFMKNIEGRGIIIRDWAPQLEILAHKATGAFMSHCGWNSCMESISKGLPILAWPMHSDQPWNAVLVCDYLKVGVIVRDWDSRKEILLAGKIEEAIKKVMVYDSGKEIKLRAKKLGEDVMQAAADGGSSNIELLSFVAHITRP